MPAHLVSPSTDPPTSIDPDLHVPEAVYWEKYYERSDIHYEWNNGRLEEKPVSDYLTYQIYAWFVALLGHFLETNPMAKTVGLEMGFRLTLPGKAVIRKPDLGVVRSDNAVPLHPLDRSYHGVFDLCIEALSDSTEEERKRDEVGKKREYAEGGVPEYYILHHDKDRLAFYRMTRRGIYRPIASDDGIVRSRILPGFQFRTDDLLRRPAMKTLRLDPLYREFLLPGWQRAEQERDEMMQARLKAIANLHTMGLDHEQIARALGLGIDIVTNVLESR